MSSRYNRRQQNCTNCINEHVVVATVTIQTIHRNQTERTQAEKNTDTDDSRFLATRNNTQVCLRPTLYNSLAALHLEHCYLPQAAATPADSAPAHSRSLPRWFVRFRVVVCFI